MTDESRAEANRAARDEKKAAHLRAIYDRHVARFQNTAIGEATSLAREVHGAMDAVLERDLGSDADSAGIRCGRGCSHCCHEAVEIWPHEAVLLVKVMRVAGRTLDQLRLERQSAYTVDTWREQPRADKACVFLDDDGACTVYESRPNACRKLLVVTDPVLCDAAHSKPDSVGRWFSWEAELMESAALAVFGAALMPAALLVAWAGGSTSADLDAAVAVGPPRA